MSLDFKSSLVLFFPGLETDRKHVKPSAEKKPKKRIKKRENYYKLPAFSQPVQFYS
uniref:Uncharacterized protein n=1 Tax=Manihot esculenta TaxID=3983 RepID=A0A2C9ULV9_MANES